MVTGSEVTSTMVDEGRFLARTDLRGVPTPRVETATGRRMDGARDVTLEHDALAGRRKLGVRDRHCGEKRLRIGMDRLSIELLRRGDLDGLA
jgi:hypothetical protein